MKSKEEMGGAVGGLGDWGGRGRRNGWGTGEMGKWGFNGKEIGGGRNEPPQNQ